MPLGLFYCGQGTGPPWIFAQHWSDKDIELFLNFFQADKIHLRTYQKNKTVNKRYQRFFDAVYQNVAFTKFPGNKNTLGRSWPIIETGRCRIPEALAP